MFPFFLYVALFHFDLKLFVVQSSCLVLCVLSFVHSTLYKCITRTLDLTTNIFVPLKLHSKRTYKHLDARCSTRFLTKEWWANKLNGRIRAQFHETRKLVSSHFGRTQRRSEDDDCGVVVIHLPKFGGLIIDSHAIRFWSSLFSRLPLTLEFGRDLRVKLDFF